MKLLMPIIMLCAVGLTAPLITNTVFPKEMTMNSENLKAKTATFAGGCFWCVESDFEKHEGVLEAVSGYTGGHRENPKYKEVSAGTTGHLEAVQIRYDPAKISYAELLDIFWKHVDPTDEKGQFVDRGTQYTTAIFTHDDQQRQIAETSKTKLAQSGRFDKPIVTPILPATRFYPAEEYHQDYYRKNPLRYRFYRANSGRDQFLTRTWDPPEAPVNENPQQVSRPYAKPPEATLRQQLSPLQYQVTQEQGTEPPFQNTYWDNKDAGLYVDVVSGEALFASVDKFASGTGWPSFSRPVVAENVVNKEDRSLFMVRTEVRSKHADSHLGHLFPDGPAPTGQRYCINSAALRFVAVEDLEREGYGEFRALFAQ